MEWGLAATAQCAKVEVRRNHLRTAGPTMQSTATLPVIGMDIAKNVFQLHLVDAETGDTFTR